MTTDIKNIAILGSTTALDLIDVTTLQPLIVRSLKKDTFINYMRAQGKLGGQNKVPRLANVRKIADGLMSYIK